MHFGEQRAASQAATVNDSALGDAADLPIEEGQKEHAYRDQRKSQRYRYLVGTRGSASLVRLESLPSSMPGRPQRSGCSVEDRDQQGAPSDASVASLRSKARLLCPPHRTTIGGSRLGVAPKIYGSGR